MDEFFRDEKLYGFDLPANESRTVSHHPSEAFSSEANLNAEDFRHLQFKALSDPQAFWREQGLKWLNWAKPFTLASVGEGPSTDWFIEGKLNASYQALDRHVIGGLGAKQALIWEGEDGSQRTLSYRELKAETEACALVLKSLGVKKGDNVLIYLPMVPELIIATLALSRLGAVHCVVFSGFSSEALKTRLIDSNADLMITADVAFRRAKKIDLLKAALDARVNLNKAPQILIMERDDPSTTAIVDTYSYKRLKAELSSKTIAPEPMDSSAPLFLLYTSGSTGKPKGILHGTAGYLLGSIMTTHYILDAKPEDIYWCTADLGWITGHSYVLYGPLSLGLSVFLYEGALDYPDPSRVYQLIEKYKISIFYTAPTAIRNLMRASDSWLSSANLKSLRLLGSVGEPINPKAFEWFRTKVGSNLCPIVDTWWQTETGSIMLSPLPGIDQLKPGSCAKAFLGVEAMVVDSKGQETKVGEHGYLVLKNPPPSMMKTIYGDHERYLTQYWGRFPQLYFTGDAALRDQDGYFWILGRIDDVLNVAGHRLSTMEIEGALVSHPFVAEAAVVGKPCDIKGESIVAFIILCDSLEPYLELETELKDTVSKAIGAIARPSQIHFKALLPKTRSGKILRRLLRDLAQDRAISGDLSTLDGDTPSI